MNNLKEKVVQIVHVNTEIWALTEMGNLAKFDPSLGCFVQRGSSDIKTVKGEVLLKPDIPTLAPPSRYEAKDVENLPSEEPPKWINIWVGLYFGVGLILSWFLLRWLFH